MAIRIGIRDLISAGPRAVGRYTGTLLAVFVVQAVVAAACMIAVALVLAQVFAHMPLWDEAVDGDLVALLECLHHGRSALVASGGIVFGAVLLWQLATWFVFGGLAGVLAQRPEGRGDTARCFGASGATTYLAYARLALCSLPAWMLAFFLFDEGFALAVPRLAHALTVTDLFVPIAIALVPGLLVMHIFGTVTDYARIEMTLRHDSHDPSAVLTYLRSLSYVLRRPVTLVHGGLGWLCFALITLGSIYLGHGHPMYGAEGAIMLFVIRQGVALARTAIRFGVIAGQVELGRTRPLPPRRLEPKAEAKP